MGRPFSQRVDCDPESVGKQTHDLTVIASDSKTTQSGGDNRKKFPLGAALRPLVKVVTRAQIRIFFITSLLRH